MKEDPEFLQVKEAVQAMADKYGYSLVRTLESNQTPTSVVIQAGATWAIKVTKDGIFSNPDVPTDEGAKAVFAALEPYLMGLRKSGG